MADEISFWGTVLLMMILDFQQMAVEFKKFFGLKPSQNFQSLSIAENKLCGADMHFKFSVIADSEWNHKESIQAYYIHKNNHHEIGIKETVYNKACSGDKAALTSIAHEIVHWGLMNYFRLTLGITEPNIDSTTKMILKNIHENITDLLTALLIFSQKELEGELQKNKGEGEQDCQIMSDSQISLALFYSQNHNALKECSVKDILSIYNRKRRFNSVPLGQKK